MSCASDIDLNFIPYGDLLVTFCNTVDYQQQYRIKRMFISA